MKLIFAIVNSDDSSVVASSLTAAGFSATKLATSGGFLKAGNATFIIGTQDDKVDEVISIVRDHSQKRTKIMPENTAFAKGTFPTKAVEVNIGGATIFVVDVDRFEKC